MVCIPHFLHNSGVGGGGGVVILGKVFRSIIVDWLSFMLELVLCTASFEPVKLHVYRFGYHGYHGIGE